jgi:ectoine hydroxylase-related dioxygenase (phytanoyl-CoA dioxygenase family)
MARIVDVSTHLGERLTPAQRSSFQEQGFLHFRSFLHRDGVTSVLKAMQELGQRWIQGGVKTVNGTPIKLGRDVDGSPIVQRYCFASQHHPVLEEVLRDPRFNALLELVGGDARLGTHEKDGLVINHYVNTPESNFTQMGWHTDALRDVFLGKRIGPMLNVGIHLDDQDPRNGGLRLIPGTHLQGLRSMLFRKRYFADTTPDPDEVAFDIKAGDLTVHDGRLWHRVERSRLIGEESRRRVMYIPVVNGRFQPKTEKSRTPFYHRFQHLVK